MGKTIFIAGKDLPDGGDFADGMALAGRKTAVTGNPENDRNSVSSADIVITPWNRPSSISARSAVLEAETAFGSAAEDAVLYFDAPLYASRFTGFTPDECTRAADTMVTGYGYMAVELLSRLDQRSASGRIVFLLKQHPTLEQALRSASIRSSVSTPCSPLVSAAQASFTALAENTAALAGDRPNVTVILVTCDEQNEAAAKDSTLASWLSGYLDEVEGLKNKLSAKQSLVWIKAGAKGPGLRSFFH
jgi:NAD(P)-dependent dehydrogenase (short-subunit alcohol dehydrogenase family)